MQPVESDPGWGGWDGVGAGCGEGGLFDGEAAGEPAEEICLGALDFYGGGVVGAG